MDDDLKNLETKFEKVSYSYNNKSFALKNLSFSLKPGSINALVGPSGSGKTTLLKLLSGCLSTEYGVIKFNNHAMDSLTRKKLSCFIKLYDPLPKNDTWDEAIKFYRQFQDAEPVNDAIEIICDAEDSESVHSKEMIKNLSEGQKKLLSLELHLINKPILLLDEPFAGMDLNSTLNVLEKIRQSKITTIISIHHCNEFFLNFFDSILVLKEGHLMFHSDNVEEFKKQIQAIRDSDHAYRLKQPCADLIYDLFLNILPNIRIPESEATKRKMILQTKLVGRKKLDFKMAVYLLIQRDLRALLREKKFCYFTLSLVLVVPLSFLFNFYVLNDSISIFHNLNFLFYLNFLLPSLLTSYSQFDYRLSLFRKDYECEYYDIKTFFCGTFFVDFVISVLMFAINFCILVLTKKMTFRWLAPGMLTLIFGLLYGYLITFFNCYGVFAIFELNLYKIGVLSPAYAIIEVLNSNFIYYLFLPIQMMLLAIILYISLKNTLK